MSMKLTLPLMAGLSLGVCAQSPAPVEPPPAKPAAVATAPQKYDYKIVFVRPEFSRSATSTSTALDGYSEWEIVDVSVVKTLTEIRGNASEPRRQEYVDALAYTLRKPKK